MADSNNTIDINKMITNLNQRCITVPSITGTDPSTGDRYYTDEVLNSEYHAKTEYEEAINRYGVIYKIVQFGELSDPEEIKKACREWIRRNYFDGVLSFTIKAVDLHLLGYNNTDKIMVGDIVNVVFLDLYNTQVTKKLTCMSVQYDLLKPENNTYKIGIPDVSANVKYRKSITKKSTSKGSGKPDSETDADAKKKWTDWLTETFDTGGIDLGAPENMYPNGKQPGQSIDPVTQ